MGARLLTPPVAWWSIWITLPLSVLSWIGVTALADRTAGLHRPRPPRICIAFGPEPERDERGFLDGWAEVAPGQAVRTV